MSKPLEEQVAELEKALAQANEHNLELLGKVNQLSSAGVPDGIRAVAVTYDPKTGLRQLAWTEYETIPQVALALLGALRHLIDSLPCAGANPCSTSTQAED